ncbi:Xaa-Pro aminopeptidase, partial [Shewanella algae]
YQPKKIAINTSENFGHADGLDHTEYKLFTNKLPVAFKNKIVSSEPLAVGWLETRIERELQLWPQLIKLSKDIIAEGFSNKVITP